MQQVMRKLVKQSMSSMMSVLSGIFISIIVIALCVVSMLGFIKNGINIMLIIYMVGLTVLMIVLVLILNNYGVKRYREI